MELLKTELHCHNKFSNFHIYGFDTPYDCNIEIQEQLEQSNKLGLDVLFVTNHNTLDGYDQLLKYKKNYIYSILDKCFAFLRALSNSSSVIIFCCAYMLLNFLPSSAKIPTTHASPSI